VQVDSGCVYLGFHLYLASKETSRKGCAIFNGYLFK